MRAVAEACVRDVFEVENPRISQLTWKQHCEAGHVPLRRACRVCQESSAKARPHRSVRHPLVATLSVDTAGPLAMGRDVEQDAKYFLCGTFTWLKPLPEKPEKPKEDAGEELVEEDEKEEEGWEELEAGEESEEEEGLQRGEAAADEIDGVEVKEEERLDPEIEVFKFATPIPSKAECNILEVLNLWHIQLRVHGYEIRRLHSDRGGEFFGRGVQKWAAARGILRTSTARDTKANGRAEKAIQEVKARIRRALHGASMPLTDWPLACRYVHEHEKMKMMDRFQLVPPFGQEILVRKRYWKTKELEATHERVRYIAPVPESHGHLILRPDDSLAVVPYVIGKTQDPPVSDETWLGILNVGKEEEDAYAVRRRIRGKTAVRSLKLEDEEEAEAYKKRLQSILHEEAMMLLEDDQEVADVLFEGLKKLRKAALEEVEEDVLRTRVVSPQEILKDPEGWRSAIETELNQLLTEKMALQKIDRQQLRHLQEVHGDALEVVPSKIVATLKPGPRKRLRLVACGNFCEKQEDETLYASGADAVAFRYLLKRSAEESWLLIILDIRVAFLYAPLDQVQEGRPTVLKAPGILVKLGYFSENEYLLALKTMYGLRQSPRCWGLHRDSKLRSMRSSDGMWFKQSDAEQNLWSVCLGDAEKFQVMGMMLVYVDDICISAPEEVAWKVVHLLQEEWQTSEPEVAGEKPVKFLGMEVVKRGEDYYATQHSYVKDHKMDGPQKKILVPCMKDAPMPIPQEGPVDKEALHAAQKVTGELLWLVQRTRPELMYVVSKMSHAITSAPEWVVEQGALVWNYVKQTINEGLRFAKDKGESWSKKDTAGIEAYSDSSFSPHGQPSQGCVVIMWNGAAMLWKSGRQAFPTLSTSESELLELVESFQMADAFNALIEEHEEGYDRMMFCDNSAAVSLVIDANGSWRC